MKKDCMPRGWWGRKPPNNEIFVAKPHDKTLARLMKKRTMPLDDVNASNYFGILSKKAQSAFVVSRCAPYNKKNQMIVLSLFGRIIPVSENNKGTVFKFNNGIKR